MTAKTITKTTALADVRKALKCEVKGDRLSYKEYCYGETHSVTTFQLYFTGEVTDVKQCAPKCCIDFDKEPKGTYDEFVRKYFGDYVDQSKCAACYIVALSVENSYKWNKVALEIFDLSTV